MLRRVAIYFGNRPQVEITGTIAEQNTAQVMAATGEVLVAATCIGVASAQISAIVGNVVVEATSAAFVNGQTSSSVGAVLVNGAIAANALAQQSAIAGQVSDSIIFSVVLEHPVHAEFNTIIEETFVYEVTLE